MPRASLLIALPLLALAGCVERRIEITSEPSGALVWLNDQQVGRTPTQATFLYHGVYDVRLELSGYEPLRTEAEAKAPLYENAPLDLVAEALPMRINNIQRWHFVLEPSLESTLPKDQLEGDLLTRAAAMRTELDTTAPPPDEPEQDADKDNAASEPVKDG